MFYIGGIPEKHNKWRKFETCFIENILRLSIQATQSDVEATNDQIKFQVVKGLLTEKSKFRIFEGEQYFEDFGIIVGKKYYR